MRDLSLLLARILLSALFLFAGYGKLMAPAGFAAMLASKGMPLPDLMAYGVGAFEILGGLAILLGVLVQPVAWALAAFCVATAFIGHMGDSTAMLKNFGLAGGFLALAAAGAGAYAVGGRHADG